MRDKLGSLVLALCSLSFSAVGGVDQAVDQFIPKLAAENVSDRYAAQMELQAVASKASRPGAELERAELAKILAAKAVDAAVPQPARVWIVRQIEYIGGAESITSLTLLLNGRDAELKECARRALEKNPAPAAGEVLRTALEQGGEPSWKIGLIESLGERRDAKAVELITGQLGSKETAAAAISALGKIASADSVRTLWEAYDTGNPAAADGLISAGNHLIATGNRGNAEAIFSRLYFAGMDQPGATPAQAKERSTPLPVRCAALVGLAGANPKVAQKPVAAALESKDSRLQYAAITAAVLAYGKNGVSKALAPLLPNLQPTAKIYALAHLDASAEQQVLSATSDADDLVQEAAFEALGRIGSAASLPVLLKTAVAGSPEAQKAATTALAKVSGAGIESAIAKQAGQGDANSRAAAIRVLAARDDKNAVPALMKYAGESDRTVSSAACLALGKLAGEDEIDALARLALSGNSPGAGAALQAVASRAKDKGAAAKKVVQLIQPSESQEIGLLFETLTALGGTEALSAVLSSVSSGNQQVKDAAIRALASWPDFAATGPLLVIAADTNATRIHQVLAIQGVVRLIKASDREPAEARLEAAKSAMNSARRDEDKRMALSAFATVTDARAAAAIKSYLTDAKFGSDAGLAGITLAEALRRTDKPAAKDLALAVKQANLSEDLTRKAEALLKKN